MIRPATDGDLDAIRSLLAEADLPSVDLSLHRGRFITVAVRGGLEGVAGVEVYGAVALLRSVAVRPGSRNLGIGIRLCCEACDLARLNGVHEVFLLTTAASGFFQKLGFAPLSRSSAPPQIQATRQFAELCPESSVLMHRRLDDPADHAAVVRLRSAYEAFLRGDVAALQSVLGESALYHLPGRHLGGGRLVGWDAIIRRAAAAARACDEMPRAQVIDALGNAYAVVTREIFVARRGGSALTQEIGVVWRLNGGRCVELWAQFDDQDACDAFWGDWRPEPFSV